MKKKNEIKGFTLIEMLAVMFLIAIIFSITIPAFGPMISTLKLNNASENLANTIESARQYAMTKGNDVYVVFPISTNTDLDCKAYKIYDSDNKNPNPSPHTVGKCEILPIGIRIDSSSTALNGDDISLPFPEDTDGDTPLKYLICGTDGSAVREGVQGPYCSITLFYDINGDGIFDTTNDRNLSQKIVVYSGIQKVTIKDIGVE